ncbi:MAG: hypothetical protein AAF429_05175 [Pseudomonadota bacterium]
MHRRSFLAGLTALFAVPKPALALSAKASPELYAKAKFLARAHNKSSVPMLMRHLKVEADVATRINTLLYRRGVITAPIGGTSLAISPTNTHALPLDAPKQTDRLRQIKELAERLLDRSESAAEERDETEVEIPEAQLESED